MAVDTSTVQVVMPAMGDSVAEGTVLEWHKEEGDTVAADETIVEISTDKVDAEVPSPVAGTITKLHAAEGDTVAVGALLAEIATNADGAPNGAVAAESLHAGVRRVTGRHRRARRWPARPPRPRVSPPPSRPPVRPWTSSPPPAVSRSPRARSSSGRSRSVTQVKDGDTVVEISTDKVDMELPAPADGTITEILAEEGETVTVGQVIARMSVGGGAPSGNGGSAASTAPSAEAGSAGPLRPSPPRATAQTVQRLADSPPRRGRRGSRPLVGPRYRPGRPDHQGRRPRPRERRHRPARRPAGRCAADQGRRGRAGPLHGPEPLDPDGHVLPHVDRHHPGRAPQAAQERAASGSPSPTSSPTRSPAWPPRTCR